MFLSDRVPGHADRLERTEGAEHCLELLLPHLEVDAAHIDPAHQHYGLLLLQGLGLGLLVGQSLLHEDNLDTLLHGIPANTTDWSTQSWRSLIPERHSPKPCL